MSTTELSLGPDAIRQITTGEVAMHVIDHKQVESLLAAERRTLEMIACGASLTDVLEDLCDTIDDQAPEIISLANWAWHGFVRHGCVSEETSDHL